MPWDQIVTAAAVVVLSIGGWIYAWRPERPPHRRVAPRADGAAGHGPQLPLGG